MAGGSSVAAADSPFSLAGTLVLRHSQVLNTWQGDFAVAAPGSLGLLAQALGDQVSSGSTDRTVAVLHRVVRVARSATEPTGVRCHRSVCGVVWIWCERIERFLPS